MSTIMGTKVARYLLLLAGAAVLLTLTPALSVGLLIGATAFGWAPSRTKIITTATRFLNPGRRVGVSKP